MHTSYITGKKKEKGKKINNTNNYTAWSLIVPGEKGVTYC
jgi:hypothetical protein